MEEKVQLSDAEYFNVQSLPVLEASVANQVAKATYNARANRGVLKLYQLNPSKQDTNVVVQILAKSLMALPDPDFLLALYLIPDRLHTAPQVAALIELERCLQLAQFKLFWEKASEEAIAPFLATITGFNDAVRDFIAKALNRTYQKIELAVLKESLHLASGRALGSLLRMTLTEMQDDATTFAAKRGWTIEGSMASLPLIAENAPRPKKAADDSVKYSDFTALVQSLR